MNAPHKALHLSVGTVLSAIILACTTQPRPVAPDPSGQSYAEALGLICNVDHSIATANASSELERQQARNDYIIENTKNGDAIYFVTIFRTKTPKEQAQLLRQESVKQNLSQCELAKTLDADCE